MEEGRMPKVRHTANAYRPRSRVYRKEQPAYIRAFPQRLYRMVEAMQHEIINALSSSADPWFEDEENRRIVRSGINSLEAGGGKIYTSAELKQRLGQ